MYLTKRNKELVVDKTLISLFVENLNLLGFSVSNSDIIKKNLKLISKLEENIKKEMIGQEHAIQIVSNFVKRNFIGFKRKNKPIASFLFCGPTGVGKTELSKLLCKNVFFDLKKLIRIDMSEYIEKASVSKLIGAAPGYVGYESGGQLTSKVSEFPDSLVLLDEMEKADPQVLDLFLQVLDEAHLTDSTGKEVFFDESIIIFTSNIGSTKIFNWFRENKNVDKLNFEDLQSIVNHELSTYFRPEFLNRLDDIIVFYPLLEKDINKILELELEKRIQDLKDSKNITIEISSDAKKFLLNKGFDYKFGARSIKRSIANYFEVGIADFLISNDILSDTNIFVDVKGKKLSFVFN